jgi:hypothetical protein
MHGFLDIVRFIMHDMNGYVVVHVAYDKKRSFSIRGSENPGRDGFENLKKRELRTATLVPVLDLTLDHTSVMIYAALHMTVFEPRMPRVHVLSKSSHALCGETAQATCTHVRCPGMRLSGKARRFGKILQPRNLPARSLRKPPRSVESANGDHETSSSFLPSFLPSLHIIAHMRIVRQQSLLQSQLSTQYCPPSARLPAYLGDKGRKQQASFPPRF